MWSSVSFYALLSILIRGNDGQLRLMSIAAKVDVVPMTHRTVNVLVGHHCDGTVFLDPLFSFLTDLKNDWLA